MLAAGSAACSASHTAPPGGIARGAAGNPALAGFLAGAHDLGPTRHSTVSTVLTLRSGSRPTALLHWAAGHSLHVDWRTGDDFAAVSGPTAAMQTAFRVQVHDYRGTDGKSFFATAQRLALPGALHADVRGAGEILSYLPPPNDPVSSMHDAVPSKGLTPDELLTTYRAKSLADQGYTGKGQTVVFFEWAGWKQSDMDAFASSSGLPRFTPVLSNGPFSSTDDETPMDLEVVHAIVPDARLVVVNATNYLNKYNNGPVAFARMFQDAAAKYPKSVWSLSIYYGCEAMLGATEITPMETALAAAESKYSITAFLASGDTGSLECKAFVNGGYATPPRQIDVGLIGEGGLPHMTMVGGTLLSTDPQGNRVAEEAWTSTAMSQGTSGGTSIVFKRPSWQNAPGVSAQRGSTMRLSPDVAADADPASGVRLIEDGKEGMGGGTSQAAPIWAGITTIMNAYLQAHGGTVLGDINPLLYKAARIDPSSFHDITLGGSAVDSAAAGYDETTGLGTPDVEKLVIALGKAQKGGQ